MSICGMIFPASGAFLGNEHGISWFGLKAYVEFYAGYLGTIQMEIQQWQRVVYRAPKIGYIFSDTWIR